MTEFRRVLAPEAHLLVGFYDTDGPSLPTQNFNHLAATAYRWSPDHLVTLLHPAGLPGVAR